MITAKSSFVEEKYTAQYYSGNSCLYVSGAGDVLAESSFGGRILYAIRLFLC